MIIDVVGGPSISLEVCMSHRRLAVSVWVSVTAVKTAKPTSTIGLNATELTHTGSRPQTTSPRKLVYTDRQLLGT